jgi:competence protein ComEC
VRTGCEILEINKLFLSIILVISILLIGIPGLNASAAVEPPKNIVVHFIDVGQADSILVQFPDGKVSLIDAGNVPDATDVIKYIKALGIKKIDYIIGTHPHEDHIGGMADVIKAFEIGKIYMPKVAHTTKAYEYLLLAIKAKKLTINEPKAGTDIIALGDIKYSVLAPTTSTYKELNDYSIVTKLTYKSNSFLFAGDAEKISEDLIIKAKYNLKADVLKVGHHGSTTSTSPAFAKVVNPKYSIISVGKDNSYNHPDNLIINRLKAYGEVHRTDQEGTIVITSDGSKLTLKALKTSIAATPAVVATMVTPTKPVTPVIQDNIVYITRTGTKYHKEGCSSLSQSKIEIKLADAIAKGYGPCTICKP